MLDTWFSSALWPFSTLGWPEKTNALKTFYPTSIMETGSDIIFFWVARMIMMGIHFMGEVPFSKVYLHALVRDEKGEKMSKSKGNVVDPLVVVDQHGADPLRFTLAAMAGQGRDIKLSVDRVEGYRAFCNKIWNATKFFHLQLEPEQGGPIQPPPGDIHGGTRAWIHQNFKSLAPINRWIISRLQTVADEVQKGLENFELNESAQALYSFTWLEFCDWYIEFSKLQFKKGAEARQESLYTLHYVLETCFALLHPFVPFVTEELWQSLPWIQNANTPARNRQGKPPLQTLMFQAFPQMDKNLIDFHAIETIQSLKAVIEAIRNFRGENNIPPKVEFAVEFSTTQSEVRKFFQDYQADLLGMAKMKALTERKSGGSTSEKDAEAVIPLSSPSVELRIGLKGLVNVDEEYKRLTKEVERTTADLEFIRNKLAKESFISKAPPELVAKERAKEQEYLAKLSELKAAFSRLEKLK